MSKGIIAIAQLDRFTICGNRLRRLGSVCQGRWQEIEVAKIKIGFRKILLLFDGKLKFGNRIVIARNPIIVSGEIIMSERIAALPGNERALKLLRGGSRFSLGFIDKAEIIMRFGIIAALDNRLLVMLNGRDKI